SGLTVNGGINFKTIYPSVSASDSMVVINATGGIGKRVIPTGTGTVTSIATGLGLSGGTITTSGTLLVDTSSASILS
ncbi:hypothetical protein H6B14_16215, partial [Phocaeicola coprophilus]|nr:hypothetical protein [Phocaeicola coprophilus]